jgi:hypothetical protein
MLLVVAISCDMGEEDQQDDPEPTETIAIIPTITPTPAEGSPTVPASPAGTADAAAPGGSTFSGSGNALTERVELWSGLLVLRTTIAGDALDVWLKQVEPAGRLVPAITGAQDGGAYAVNVEHDGVYQLELHATATWTVTVHQPRPEQSGAAALPVDMSGAGDVLSGFIAIPDGSHTLWHSHTGAGRFVVRALDETGEPLETIVDVTGPAEGQQELTIDDGNARTIVLAITAEADWSVRIEPGDD